MNGSISFEEARFWEMLLQVGLDEDYDAWLDRRLEEEEPLSDLVTELAFCRSDRLETLHCLHEYTVDRVLDDDALFTLVWQYLHDHYVAGQMEKTALVDEMYALAALEDIHEEPWQSMDMFGLLFDEAEEGIVAVESVDRAFEDFIMDRKPIPFNELYATNEEEDPTEERIANWLIVGLIGVPIACVLSIVGFILNLLSVKPWDLVCIIGSLVAVLPLLITAIILGLKKRHSKDK